MTDARSEILERIRSALGEAGRAEGTASASGGYRRSGSRDRRAVVSLFCERVADYRASVRRCGPHAVERVVSEICAERGVRTLAAPGGLRWRPEGIELVAGDALAPSELDRSEGVITGCALAIAETGTLVLDGGPGQGPRALTLVPDFHVCVVEAHQIVETVPEALARAGAAVRQAGRPLTLVSGPSATADIEFQRVEGVHGPRTLAVLVVLDDEDGERG